MTIVVLNASQHRDGNSARMAAQFLNHQHYQQVNLVDYQIDQIGQVGATDQLAQLLQIVTTADQLVITTPIYWSDMPGYLKTFIDRSGDPSSNQFAGRNCYLLIQGFQPADAICPVTHVVEHWATRDGMQFKGVATNETEMAALRSQLTEG